MTGRRFLTNSPADADTLIIAGEEYHHLVRVMRARTGMEIEAVNGCGDWFLARITRLGQGRVEAVILQRRHEEQHPARLVLAPSILKKRPMDLMLEKLCELGVDEIRPICFARSDTDCPEEIPERWLRVARQSIKVNRRLRPTRITAPQSLDSLLSGGTEMAGRVVLEITGRPVPPDLSLDPVLCVIGPPGDFTPEERTALQAAGFFPWRLNPGVLRSETAAIAAAAVLRQRTTA